MKNRKLGGALLLLSVIGLSACGSSGGGARQPPPPAVVVPPDPARPNPVSFTDDPGLTAAQESVRSAFSRSEEFQTQWSLSAIGADYAYARGYTGKGVTVGIIDTGANPNHSSLAGKLHASSGLVSRSCPGGSCSFSPISDTGAHGTLVGGVIAAAKNGSQMHGVAYEAELLMLGIRLGTAPPVYRPVDLSRPELFRELDEQGQGLYRRIGRSTRIVNHSFGYEGVVTDYTAAQYRAAFGRIVDSLLQSNVPDSEKIILVWGAGNSNGRRDTQGNLADASSPNLDAGAPYHFPGLRRHFIAVVATQEDGTIAPYSNRCGVTADYCIAAPGSDISGPFAGSRGFFATASGTSLAAPQVAGALALMEEAFRGQLGSTEMVRRLLAAAKKTGIYADRSIYGQGFLDIEKATRPIGGTSAALGRSLEGPAASVQRSLMAAGPAWGDALQQGLAGRELAVFDSLNAPFFVPLSNFQASWPQDGGQRMDRRFARFSDAAADSPGNSAAAFGRLRLSSAAGLAAGYEHDGGEDEDSVRRDRAAGFSNAWIDMGTQGLGVGYAIASADGRTRLHSGFFVQSPGVTRGERLAVPGRAQGALLGLDMRGMRGGTLAFSAELGLLRESERLLGAGASGAWSELSGNTWFTRMRVEQRLVGGLKFLAAAQGGYTAGGAASRGLLRGARRITSSAWSAGLRWSDAAAVSSARTESLWLVVAQPLRNESGYLEMDYPTGRTRAGGVLRETARLGATPTGRQTDITLGYERSLPSASGRDGAWRFRAELWQSFEPGHRRGARPESAAFLSLSRNFAAR